MKKLFYLSFMLLMPFLSNAQTTYEDVVYLKNGSVIRGMIIEQIPNQQIKVQTKDGSIFVYKMDEVEKITKEAIQTPKETLQAPLANENTFNFSNTKQSGYINSTEFNFGSSLGSGGAVYGFQTINGYLFNPFFSASLGLGIDKYSGLTFIPIFADMRINFLKNVITPFFDAAAGYSLNIYPGIQSQDYTTYKGGLIVCPSFGVKYFINPKLALTLRIGYLYQQYIQEYNYTISYGNSYNSNYSDTEQLGSIIFIIGVTF